MESDDDAATDLIAEIADYRTPHLFYQVLEVAQFQPRLAKDVHHLSEFFPEVWSYGAPNPPGGKFSEYIPFYLGHRSPMLYQIATGYEGVEKIPQSDIVYVVVNHDCIV